MKKTRGHFSFLLMGCLLAASSAYSQKFQDKYRSKTQFTFKKQKDTKTPNIHSHNESEQEQTLIKSMTSSAVRNASDSNSNPFGKRAESFGLLKRDDSFVHLNPETAFGPEIVESFDFPDTDILKLTKHMQKLTGINLILDKDVKGKISISAPSAITVGDAWRAYLTALNMNGFTIVPSGKNFYKIIPARNIRNTPTTIYTGGYTPDTDNYIMKVIPLKYINAAEVNKAFRSFTTQNGRIIPMNQTNTVLIMDTGTNISRLLKLIKYLDVPGHDESLQIIRVKHSSAQEIAKLLDQILNKSKTTSRSRISSSSRNNKSNISKIIAEPRTNSIIAMANATGARQLKKLIAKLDVSRPSANSGKIHVYYLQHGDAEELSKTLSGLLSSSAPKRSSSSRFSRSNDDNNSIFSSEVKVTADKNNNALIVTSAPTDWLTLLGVLKKLDIPKDQVMVEGMVVETEVKKERSLGVSYSGFTGTGSFDQAGFNSTANGKLRANIFKNGIASLGGLFAGLGIGSKKSIIFNGNTYNVSSVHALLTAVASNSNNNVLATPKILVMDNKEAEFEVGSKVSVPQTTLATATSPAMTSPKMIPVTLKFKITPQINKVTRFVKLKINQQLEDFAGGTNFEKIADGSNQPITTTRSAITEVVIKDRDTVVMGGLLRDKENVSRSKIPLLGDIPVLGWLFKNKSRSITKTNILFFITPTIISPYDKVANELAEKSLKDREEFLKPALYKGEETPFKKTMSKLEDKIQRQKAGPLYDESDTDVYKKANDQSMIDLLNEQVPNYQEAIEAMRE